MSLRPYLIVALVLTGLQVATGQNSPQNPSTQNAPAQDSGANSSRSAPAAALSGIAGMDDVGTEDTSTSLPRIPPLLGGAAMSSAFVTELERSNYLRGGINLGATYDSNPLLLSNGVESNTSETVFPNVRIDESSSRMRWSLGYAGGLTVNQKFTAQNQGSHNLNFDSQYRLSPHVNLRVAENFSMMTGFFDAGNGVEAVGVSQGPNASLIAPLSTQRSSLTTVETNYHYALDGLVGASGSFYDLHFTNVPAGTVLTDSQTASGSAFWLHRLVQRDWGGVSYSFQRITFNPDGETRVHNFLAVDSVSLSNRFTLTGYIGPQYLENRGLIPGGTTVSQSNSWSVAGGVDGAWRGQHTGVSGGFSRTVSDGGGVLGPVRLQNVHGTLRRELVTGWAASFNASYGKNQSLVAASPNTASAVNSTSVGLSIERNVGKSLGLRFGYSHDFQQQFGVPGPTPTSPTKTLDASRNRVFVTLSYQWSKPLGM